MILVTGGTGFLGAYIIQHLIEKGYAVRAIKRSSSKLPFYIPANILNKVEWVEGDVLDVVSLEDAMEGIDTVIHSAAVISMHGRDREHMFQTNVDGTANVVNMALEKNISRFVYISSVAALGRTTMGDTVNEEKEWLDSKINTHYAISKHKAELEVWRGIGEGLNAVILNPSTLIGYGDWNQSSCLLFKNTFREFPYYTDGINGFADVEDAARATVLLMESDINGERFIISSDNWPFKKLMETIADGFHKKRPYKYATPLMGSIAWRVEKMKALLKNSRPILTKESAKLAHSKTYFDNSKILAALPGFTFNPLENCIEKSCAQYLEHPQSIS